MQRRVGVVDQSRVSCVSMEFTEGGTDEAEGKKKVRRTEGNFAIRGPEKWLCD